MLRADLHMHSVYSDGTLTIKKLLDYAKSKRLDIIAITDHDSTEGVSEAIEYGKEINIIFFFIQYIVSYLTKFVFFIPISLIVINYVY